MKTELRILFFSPIAWLILIVFAIQAGFEFCELFSSEVRSQASGFPPYAPTETIFASFEGVCSKLMHRLYLYIPLLTMGLISRELSSGSMKLLYSSPVKNYDIILGKYLSVMIYSLTFVVILLAQAAFGFFVIKNMDIWMVLTAILGVYLTVCAYAAIGLFMSTITHYQVVAAIGTFAVLGFLNYVGSVGQDIAFVRDLTYWLSISGRSSVFLEGMICSKDLLYFMLVIFMFLSFSIIKLHGETSKDLLWKSILKYGAVFAVVLVLGYVSSRPAMIKYWDLTATKSNTLSVESQEIVNQLKGDLTITTYANLLERNFGKGKPANLNMDMEQFNKYLRFKPEIQLKYVYYYDKGYHPIFDKRFAGFTDREKMEYICKVNNYDTNMFLTPEEIKAKIDLSGEDNRFVRVIEYNGKRTFLRLYEDTSKDPSEIEVTSALKTFLIDSPVIGFVAGHGERDINSSRSENGYGIFTQVKTFRYALINQGFDVKTVELDTPLSDDVDILVIADVKSSYSDTQMKNLSDFIDKGGNFILLGENKRQSFMNPIASLFGLKFSDDILVQPSKNYLADLVTGHFTKNGDPDLSNLSNIGAKGSCITMPTACAVEWIENKGYKIIDVLKSKPTGVWNEKQTANFIDEKVTLDTLCGEVEKSYALIKYLSREVGDKQQRIFVLSDADCISNDEINKRRNGIKAANFKLITEMCRVLAYNEFPVRVTKIRPIDDDIYITQDSMVWVKGLFIYLLPILIVICSLWIWLIRRSR